MTFYEALSAHYDELFPVSREEMAFTAALVGDKRPILDIGCGTGNKTVLLGGGSIIGVDADPAMIRRARADNARAHVSYEVVDMAGIAARFAPASFGAAVCLGNTLVHATEPGAIEAVCASVRTVLKPGGVFVCQILNYARILDRGITELPVIETPDVRFSRHYSGSGPLLDFSMELRSLDSGETLRGSVPLRPMRPEALRGALLSAGFTCCEAYGSFDGAHFTEDAFLIIAAAVA